MALIPPVFDMMLKGVRTDLKAKRRLAGELLQAKQERGEWFEKVLGHPLNPDSHTQVKALLYHDFGMKEIKDRKTKAVTANDDALELIMYRQPLLTPLIQTIQEYRSLRVFKSTFVDAIVDDDERMRCSFNITGTETFRFSSSKNAFGTGCNFQNIPVGTEDD